MALSVDKVYKTVLYILNTDQTGNLNPEEFNHIAEQVQLGIYENYFFDLHQLLRRPQPTEEYADTVRLLEEKMSIFKTTNSTDLVSPTAGEFTLTSDIHKLNTVHFFNNEAVKVNRKDYNLMQKTPLVSASEEYPCYLHEGNSLYILPTTVFKPTISYMRKPNAPAYKYTLSNVGEIIPDATHDDFELHATEQAELVAKILAYAGHTIKDMETVQAAMQLSAGKDQIEKQ